MVGKAGLRIAYSNKKFYEKTFAINEINIKRAVRNVFLIDIQPITLVVIGTPLVDSFERISLCRRENENSFHFLAFIKKNNLTSLSLLGCKSKEDISFCLS